MSTGRFRGGNPAADTSDVPIAVLFANFFAGPERDGGRSARDGCSRGHETAGRSRFCSLSRPAGRCSRPICCLTLPSSSRGICPAGHPRENRTRSVGLVRHDKHTRGHGPPRGATPGCTGATGRVPARPPVPRAVLGAVVGPSSVLLLRHCVSLWRDATPARVPTEDLARQIGLGRGTGRHSPLQHTIDRLVHFRFASMATPGELHIYTEVPPLSDPPARPASDLVTKPARTAPWAAPRWPGPRRRPGPCPERATASRPHGSEPRPPHQPRRVPSSNPRPMIVPRRRSSTTPTPVSVRAATPAPVVTDRPLPRTHPCRFPSGEPAGRAAGWPAR